VEIAEKNNKAKKSKWRDSVNSEKKFWGEKNSNTTLFFFEENNLKVRKTGRVRTKPREKRR